MPCAWSILMKRALPPRLRCKGRGHRAACLIVSNLVPHCRRSVLGALDFGANTLAYHVASSSIKGDAVIAFLELVAQQGDERPTEVVLDNASIDHAIDPQAHERWLREHRMQLFYPPYSPELNLIEIVWKQAKYRWRNFVTWTKETIDDEVRRLLDGYGTKFQINFV